MAKSGPPLLATRSSISCGVWEPECGQTHKQTHGQTDEHEQGEGHELEEEQKGQSWTSFAGAAFLQQREACQLKGRRQIPLH